MSVKVYTQEEVDAILPDENGIKHFPTGDYRAIKKFVGLCEFGEKCKFGAECSFGNFCKFGLDCRFGESCKFGRSCAFNRLCNFGFDCTFGESCCFGGDSIFGESCKFGRSCAFNHSCNFGGKCEFGHQCKFGEKYGFGLGCTFEKGFKAKTTLPFITLGGAGSEARTCYFYDFEKGIHVRAGCFFGSLEEFKAKVLKDEETPETPSKKTRVYLSFCDTVEIQFN